MRLATIILFTILVGTKGVSQPLITSGQFYQLYPSINPGYTGIDDYVNIVLSHNKKWTGASETPTSSSISAFAPLKNQTSYNQSPIRTSNPNQGKLIESQKSGLRFHGLGGSLITEKYGPYNMFSAEVNYAYHIPISKSTKFALGSSLGFGTYRLDLSSLTVWNPTDDPLYQSLGTDKQNTSIATLNMGGAIYSSNYHFGLSYAPSLGENELVENPSLLQVTSGGRLDVSENIYISPQIVFTIKDFNRVIYSAVIGSRIAEPVYVGLGYSSSSNAIIGNLAINVNRMLELGYSFQSSGLNQANFDGASHSILVSLRLANHLNALPTLW